MNKREQTAGGFEISSTLFMFLKGTYETSLSKKLRRLRTENARAEKTGGDAADIASNASVSSEIMVLEKKVKQARLLLNNNSLAKKVYREQSIEVMTGNGILLEVTDIASGQKNEKIVYLLGCNLDVHLKGITILTLKSPIAELLKGRVAGSTFNFKDKKYTIKRIFSPSEIEESLIEKIRETNDIFEEEMIPTNT